MIAPPPKTRKQDVAPIPWGTRRAQCWRCEHRFAIGHVAAGGLYACPKCRLIQRPNVEPVDEVWWKEAGVRVPAL